MGFTASHVSFQGGTPLKIYMETQKNEGKVWFLDDFFFFKQVIFRFQLLIFQGVSFFYLFTLDIHTYLPRWTVC